jgi:hypothetical protein
MRKAILCLLCTTVCLAGCGSSETKLRDLATKTTIEISHPGATKVETSTEDLKSLQGEVTGHKYTAKWTKDEKPVSHTIEFNRKIVSVDGKEIGTVGDGSTLKIDENGNAKIETAK